MTPHSLRLAGVAWTVVLLAVSPLPAQLPLLDCHGDPLPDGALARMGTTRLRHGDGVGNVVYSPDGTLMASTSRDRTLRVWEAANGRQKLLITENNTDYYAIAWSPDGATLAAAGGDPFHDGNTAIRFIDVKSGNESKRLEGHVLPAYCLAFNADASIMISVSRVEVIRWNVASGAKLSEWKLQSTADLAVSPDLSMVAWVDGERMDKTIHLAEAATGKEVRTLKGHGEAVASIAWSPDGKYLASCNPAEPIHIWKVAAGKVSRRLEHPRGATKVRFSADGAMLCCGWEDGSVRLWELKTGTQLPKLTGYRGWINALNFAPDGKSLALAGSDSNLIRVWDIANAVPSYCVPGHLAEVNAIAYSPDGKLLATSGGEYQDTDHIVCLWDSATGKLAGQLVGHRGKVCCLQFSPDGKLLAAGSEREALFRVWDVATCKELAKFQRKQPGNANDVTECRVNSLAWSPDGSFLASAHDQGTLILWDAKTGQELEQMRHYEIIRSIAFSPDSKLLVTGGIDVRLRAVPSLKEPGRKTDDEGKHANDPFAALGDSVRSVAFAPDGSLIAASVGDNEGIVHLLDANSGRVQACLPAVSARIEQIAFSPDGKLLAGTGPDNTLCVWEIATRAERCRFPGSASAVAFAPEGRTIACGNQDTTVLIWDVGFCEALARHGRQPELDQYWNDLGSADAKAAHRAISVLTSAPAETLGLLKQKLQPIGAMDLEQMAKVLNELDHARYAVRESATIELARLGELAEPFLKQTLQREPSLEVQQRVQFLLAKLESVTLSPEQRRAMRAFEILERIGGEEARSLVEVHASHLPANRLGREAQASLERMSRGR